MARICASAAEFIGGEPAGQLTPCRFDVVAASGDPASPALEWLKDAFRADDA